MRRSRRFEPGLALLLALLEAPVKIYGFAVASFSVRSRRAFHGSGVATAPVSVKSRIISDCRV